MAAERDDDPRRGSDLRFRARRAAVIEELRSLLGTRSSAEVVDDADRAAALAAEARASHRDAEPDSWAIVRRAWEDDDRSAVTYLLHAIGEILEPRATWLILPGREPQAVALPADAILDNPVGFAALSDFELVMLDQRVPAGLWLLRRARAQPSTGFSWEMEVWGEPWLSAATRAIRESRG